MYSVDQRDTVVEVRDTPPSSVGSPGPIVVATEHTVHLACYLLFNPLSSRCLSFRAGTQPRSKLILLPVAIPKSEWMNACRTSQRGEP
jgi:hypothetical protein